MSIEQLYASEDNWVTAAGKWFPGERVVYRGRDLLSEFSGKPWMSLLLFGITGREFTAKQIQLFEACWNLSTSFPDPRLWNNRIAALAGTVRSTAALAIGAATAVSEATIYGRRPDVRAIDFLMRVRRETESGRDVSEVVQDEIRRFRGAPGYGRPIVRRDERIEPVLRLARSLDLCEGPHLTLALKVEEYLQSSRMRLKMNIAAAVAALAADQGLSRDEYYKYTVLSFSAGMFPCFSDALAHPEGTFFPIRCSRIRCENPIGRRRWGTVAGDKNS